MKVRKLNDNHEREMTLEVLGSRKGKRIIIAQADRPVTRVNQSRMPGEHSV
jgi:hypothetical protein